MNVLCVYMCALLLVVHSRIANIRSDGGKASYRLNLNDGKSIPPIGFGTFLGFDSKGQVNPKDVQVTQAVEMAINAGYRLIDTAPVYLDERQVGAGIDNSIKAGVVKREDVYLVTKLPSSHHGRANVKTALQNSLTDLNLEYVDLYLIHWPMGFAVNDTYDGTDYVDTWKGMEDVQKLGLAKSIGLSNFNTTQIQRVLDNSEIKPAVLQVEVNLNLRQGPLIDFCKAKNIVVMAYTPFGSLFASNTGENAPPPPRKDDPKLVEIATKYGKTTPQIVIRYLVQRGLVPIPKSVNKERIEKNIDVFDFELTPEEVQTLDAFNKDYRTVNPSFWQNHPDYPFERSDKPTDNPFEG